jgi:hypothetical protein
LQKAQTPDELKAVGLEYKELDWKYGPIAKNSFQDD